MTRKSTLLFWTVALLAAVIAVIPGVVAIAGGDGTRSNFPIPLPLRSIAGQTVSVQTGEPVASVGVTLVGHGVYQSQRSDGKGMFLFQNLPPGTYAIHANGGFPRKVGLGGYDVFVTLPVDSSGLAD
jgi:hypothetical protein